MGDLVLYNYTMSVCSMKTRLAMYELGLSFENKEVDIGFAHENFEPWYVRLNPKAVVPTLKHKDKIITNSAEIVLYLAELAEKGLPRDEKLRKDALDWYWRGDRVNFQVITYARKGVPRGDELLKARIACTASYAEKYPDLKDIYLAAHARITQHETNANDLSGLKAAEADLRKTMDDLSAQIGSKDFIVGSDYSVADLMWTVLLARVEMIGLTEYITERPTILKYYQRMKARPSFAEARVMPNWKGGI